MQIKKRSFPLYVFLNCITLGIYGFIVSTQVDNEINAICKGDGEETKFGYAGSVMFRAIPSFLGIVIGFIAGLVFTSDLAYVLSFGGFGEVRAAVVFVCMTIGGIVATLIGSIVSGIYHKYWWYKQANRLKLNAGRYNLKVKESGTDVVMFRTIIEILTLPVTITLLCLAEFIPLLLVWLITLAESSGALIFASILLFLFEIPMMMFGMELTAGANFSTYFMFKNLNRFSDVVAGGAEPFDKMAYEYYPSNESAVAGVPAVSSSGAVAKNNDKDEFVPTAPVYKGNLVGVKGSCGGYNFELTPGEEFVIGKDAKVSSIVIDPAYKEISRKHCGVTYNQVTDNFAVVDYSSNGTWANDIRLIRGEVAYFPKGTVLKLANDKNVFRLD